MPIYEYRCEACGRTTESLQKLSEPPLEECPHCHRPALKRLVSATVFRLKGKGWYETDFKSSQRRNVYDAPEGGGAKDADAAPKPAAPAAAAGEKDGHAKKEPASTPPLAPAAASPAVPAAPAPHS